MPSVRNFAITYDRLNDRGTFSEGDTITGKVTLELEKESKIESLSVKAKGDIKVHWSERHGDHSRNFSAHTRVFKQKHFLITPEANGVKLPTGQHVFKFSIKIPQGHMPSSFRGNYGKVVYKLEAKLCRSWRIDRTDEKEICFWSKSFPNIDQMNFSQVGSTNKEVGVFSKGSVQMDVTVDRRGYVPGDTVSINAKVKNSSSKDVTPKFSLIQDVTYRADGNTKYEKSVINKDVWECVKPQTVKEHRFSIKIPSDTPLSIQNCNILTVEYRIKAYLDISFSFDPEVVFPLVLFWVSPHTAGDAVGGQSTSDFLPPVSFPSPYSPAPYSGASLYPTAPQYPANPTMYAGAASMNPVSLRHFVRGYFNPVPQQQNAYGSPFSSSSSASVLHPPPPPPPALIRPPSPAPAHSQFSTAPPTYNSLEPSPPSYPFSTPPSAPMMPENFLSQSSEEPPSYDLLFPSSNGSNPPSSHS